LLERVTWCVAASGLLENLAGGNIRSAAAGP
jgi:hypothetical protein